MKVTRASFLAWSAAAGGALLVPGSARGDIRDDLRLLGFALTLEYVQSALYRDALKRVPGIDAPTRTLLETVRDHEIEHVDALRALIRDGGGQPNDRPRVEFGVELESLDGFLKLANTLEDTAVSGLNGAAPALENEDFVAAFASIVQVEARHAAVIRMLRDKPPAPLPLDKASNETAVRQAYGPYTIE